MTVLNVYDVPLSVIVFIDSGTCGCWRFVSVCSFLVVYWKFMRNCVLCCCLGM